MRMRSTYHDVKNEFSTLLYLLAALVDVGTFAMNRRTTLSDLTPKTMKSGSVSANSDITILSILAAM